MIHELELILAVNWQVRVARRVSGDEVVVSSNYDTVRITPILPTCEGTNLRTLI